MFSIIIPLYNKSQYILKAVDSVLKQTYQKFELIIVDDGSKDDGLEKVIKLKDKRIKIIEQPNAGVSPARNNGVKEAKYNYIAFLDADDWWDEHFLEEMNGLIEEFPGAGIYGCNYYYVKNGKKRVEDKGLPEGFTAGYIDYIRIYASTLCVPFNSSSVIVDKKAFHDVQGFKPLLKFGEDFDLWIRIALKHKVAYLNKPLAYSNQDVYVNNRGVNPNRTYKKHEHYIFQLDYLRAEENRNADLKNLLDRLRASSLLRYYLSNTYTEETHEILSRVDFARQPISLRLKYKMPRILVSLHRAFFRKASNIKQYCIKKYYSLKCNKTA